MAFKMTPGMKGNPAAKRVAGLGACGGPGQPPCPPRFQQEVTEAKVQDRKSNRFVKAKVAKKVVATPPTAPPKPPKLQINLPKGYAFKDQLFEKVFYRMFEQAIENGKYKTQEELDMAINQQLKGGGPKDPKDPGGPIMHDPKDPGGPIMYDPKDPGKLDPILIKDPKDFDEGGEYAEIGDKAKIASLAKASSKATPKA